MNFSMKGAIWGSMEPSQYPQKLFLYCLGVGDSYFCLPNLCRVFFSQREMSLLSNLNGKFKERAQYVGGGWLSVRPC